MKNNALLVEQKGVSPSDDEEDFLPKVPTKLDVITVVNGVSYIRYCVHAPQVKIQGVQHQIGSFEVVQIIYCHSNVYGKTYCWIQSLGL